MKINYFKFCIVTLLLNTAINSTAHANTTIINLADDKQNLPAVVSSLSTKVVIDNASHAKSMLRKKLANLTFFTANFSQTVESVAGEKIAQSTGKLAISKPNLANWHTLLPDELAIISDGHDVWFYDPWIEQVSVYSLSSAIAKTPILLLTSQDESLWQQYTVAQVEHNNSQNERFVITANDINSQIKSLTLEFDTLNGTNKLNKFSFLDATGQLSHIQLTDFDDQTTPKANLFKFDVPEGVQIDDQRTE